MKIIRKSINARAGISLTGVLSLRKQCKIMQTNEPRRNNAQIRDKLKNTITSGKNK